MDRGGLAPGIGRRLEGLDRHSLSIAGGKAANLVEMLQAGLPVPPGYCITTEAYARVADAAGLTDTLRALATTAAEDTATLTRLAADARERLLATPVPEDIASEIGAAYRALMDNGSPAA